MGAEAFGNVVLMPWEKTDRFADGDKLQAELYLPAEPDVIPDNAIFGRVGAALPNLTTKQERAGLDRHMPVGIDRAGNGDLVEEVEEVEVLIEHDGGAKNGVGPGLIKFLKGVG
ncbi:MAG: hypothetical protein CK551_06455 [Planctomycetaceae bacterium]|nr:MAG: hypothetical protein CK551_06455 [Planctomycetaceae bacterium]